MAKKPPKTYHLLGVAKSLEEQNQAIGMVLMRIQNLHSMREVKGVNITELIEVLNEEANKCKALLWPEDED